MQSKAITYIRSVATDKHPRKKLVSVMSINRMASDANAYSNPYLDFDPMAVINPSNPLIRLIHDSDKIVRTRNIIAQSHPQLRESPKLSRSFSPRETDTEFPPAASPLPLESNHVKPRTQKRQIFSAAREKFSSFSGIC